MLKQFWMLTKTLCKSFFRDKQAIFFVLVSPLIFMVIFGFVFAGEMGEDRVNTVAIYIDNQSEIDEALVREIIENNENLVYKEVDSLEEGENLVRNLEVDMALYGKNNSLNFYYNPVRMQDNPILEQQAAAIRAELDKKQAGLSELLTVEVNTINGGETGELEFMFPGLIALGLASAGLFVIVEAFMHYREKKVLKRLAASPMNKNIFLLSLMTSRFPGAIISAFLVLLGGMYLFNITFVIDWFLFIPYLIVGTTIMMGFGALITLFTKTADSAVQVASIFLTIMIFFSGIYFPVEFLPGYFQKMSMILPLSYVARGLRFTMGVQEMTRSGFIMESIGLLVVSLFILFIVSWKSKWV